MAVGTIRIGVALIRDYFLPLALSGGTAGHA
jgi:hypothetical protein